MAISLSEGLDNMMDVDEEERNNGFLVEFTPIDFDGKFAGSPPDPPARRAARP